MQLPTSCIYSKGNTPNFGRNRGGVWKVAFDVKKSSNIYETGHGRIKVAIEDKMKSYGLYALSIGAKINDFE